MSARAVDRRDDHVGAVELLGREVRSQRLRIVDREDGVDLGEPGQQALHDRQPGIALALAVLVARQQLHVGRLGERRLAAVDAIHHRGDLRAVLDDDVALHAELVDEVLAGDLTGLHVVGRHGRIGAVGVGVDRHDLDAGRLRLGDGGL